MLGTKNLIQLGSSLLTVVNKRKRSFATFSRSLVRLSSKYTLPSLLVKTVFGRTNLTFFKASLLFGIPMFVHLTSFLIINRHDVSHDGVMILLTYLAASWSLIGPACIWRYEDITMSKYLIMCRKVSKDKKQLYSTIKLASTTVQSSFTAKVFLAGWCCLVIYAFISSYDFMEGFGLSGKDDVWWYSQIAGVAVYSYITGIGFLLVIRSLYFIYKFAPIDANVDPLHPDQRGGLSFFGDFLAETSLMFASGALFLPILLTLHYQQFTDTSLIILVIIGLYATIIALAFIIPAWVIHKKMEVKQNENLVRVARKINELKSGCLGSMKWRNYLQYKILRDEYKDMSEMNTWPFDFSNAVTAFSSTALPIVLTVFQIMVKP